MLSATLAVLALAFWTDAHAGTLRAGAVVCQSSRDLAKYERHIARGETYFADDMLARAQCVRKRRDEQVAELQADAQRAQIQMRDGFVVWVSVTHYTPTPRGAD
jgi:hypothetical protein